MATEFKLEHPIKSTDGSEISTLKVRRPRVKDIEIMEEETTQLGKSIRLLSLVAAISEDDIRSMDAKDFNTVSEAVAGFLY
ncbi:MAG: phage tail assembly protein [Candidatus Sedimenticola sp. (ex Thyasira tokunagai)]